MQHKLCTFILAQDKKSKQEAKKSEKKDKKERKENSNETAEEKKDKKKDKNSDSKEKKKKEKDKKDKKDKKSKKHDSPNGKDLNGILDDTEELSLDDNAGLDDAGVMGKLLNCSTSSHSVGLLYSKFTIFVNSFFQIPLWQQRRNILLKILVPL
jgi:hypothetical protein